MRRKIKYKKITKKMAKISQTGMKKQNDSLKTRREVEMSSNETDEKVEREI